MANYVQQGQESLGVFILLDGLKKQNVSQVSVMYHKDKGGATLLTSFTVHVLAIKWCTSHHWCHAGYILQAWSLFNTQYFTHNASTFQSWYMYIEGNFSGCFGPSLFAN